jgi:hypothetical protein
LWRWRPRSTPALSTVVDRRHDGERDADLTPKFC